MYHVFLHGDRISTSVLDGVINGHQSLIAVYAPLPCTQYARDFYIGQWLRDAQLELEKALKGSLDAPDYPMDCLVLDQEAVPAISSSAIALQQAEVKKDVLHSFTDPKALASLKYVSHIMCRVTCTHFYH